MSELDESLDSKEWTEWLAFDRLSPIGDDRQDLLAGIVAAAGVNVWQAKDGQSVSPEDLIPDWGDRRLEYQRRSRARAKVEPVIPDELELL